MAQVSGLVNATYTYDANGNLVSGNGRTLTYTSFNAPASISTASYGYAYTYNAEHERVRLVTTGPTIRSPPCTSTRKWCDLRRCRWLLRQRLELPARCSKRCSGRNQF